MMMFIPPFSITFKEAVKSLVFSGRLNAKIGNIPRGSFHAFSEIINILSVLICSVSSGLCGLMKFEKTNLLAVEELSRRK